jgi:hypothetical protein
MHRVQRCAFDTGHASTLHIAQLEGPWLSDRSTGSVALCLQERSMIAVVVEKFRHLIQN